MSATSIITHPFREGVIMILKQHFSDEIVKNFRFTFEAERIQKLESQHIFNQLKNGVLVLEVSYYNTKNNTQEFICDVWSNWSRKKTEAHLLRMITDKAKVGKIGKDWADKGGRIHISHEILEGKFETKSPLLKL